MKARPAAANDRDQAGVAFPEWPERRPEPGAERAPRLGPALSAAGRGNHAPPLAAASRRAANENGPGPVAFLTPEARARHAPPQRRRVLGFVALALSLAAHGAFAYYLIDRVASREGLEAQTEAVIAEIILDVPGEAAETVPEGVPEAGPEVVEEAEAAEPPSEAAEAVTEPEPAAEPEPVEAAVAPLVEEAPPAVEQAEGFEPPSEAAEAMTKPEPAAEPEPVEASAEAEEAEPVEEPAETADEPLPEAFGPTILAAPPAIAEPEPDVVLPDTLARLPAARPEPRAAPPTRRTERPAQAAAAPPRARTAQPAAPARQTRQQQAPAQAPQGGAARQAASAAGAEQAYARRLLGHVERHKRYPAAAARARITGSAQLAITIDRRGGLSGARLISSSGHAVLDQEALAVARRAAPYPRPPEGVGGATYSFGVTLRFTR